MDKLIEINPDATWENMCMWYDSKVVEERKKALDLLSLLNAARIVESGGSVYASARARTAFHHAYDTPGERFYLWPVNPIAGPEFAQFIKDGVKDLKRNFVPGSRAQPASPPPDVMDKVIAQMLVMAKTRMDGGEWAEARRCFYLWSEAVVLRAFVSRFPRVFFEPLYTCATP